jgi:uncharacterized membrane protein
MEPPVSENILSEPIQYELENSNVWFFIALLFVGLGFFFLLIPVSEAAQNTRQALLLGMIIIAVLLATIGLWQQATQIKIIEIRGKSELCFVSLHQVEVYPLTACQKITRHKQVSSSWLTSSKGKGTSRILSFQLKINEAVVLKHFMLYQHKDPALEKFVLGLEKISTIDTYGFWHWKQS